MKDICFGIDVGGTTIKIGLFETTGKLVHGFEIPTRKEESGRFVLSDIAAAIEKELSDRKLEKDRVLGIGIGVPGPVLDDGTVNNCVNVGWGVINVSEELGRLTELPVKTGNDATVAALGESWQGGAKGYDNLAMFTLGTGVGGGILINGKAVNGSHGASGEVGHMTVLYDETEKCNCGKTGCLEQAASATGIVRQTGKLLKNSTVPSVLRDRENLTAKDVFDAARDGDGLAKEAVDILGKYLGIAMSHVACVSDPEIFVLGGGVSKAGRILTDAVEKNYRKYAFHASRDAKIVLAELGNDAGMYGAAKLVLED
ncbi:MAG: ROK family glucokinase [Alistipes sp.]|nr:ROK family glucokinase [Alistipes sp.]